MHLLRPATVWSLTLLLLTACSQPPSDAGTVSISWHQEDDDPVGVDSLTYGATLIRDADDWVTWVDDLPEDMRLARADELDTFSLDDSVAVAAVWGRCTETSHVVHLGGGKLEFQVRDSKPDTMCGWSPRRVEIWDVPLGSLGVTRDVVTLTG